MIAEVRLDVDGPVATMTVDHAERRNAMTRQMWTEIPPLCARISSDASVRAVVIRGAGDVAFVAGADISEFTAVRHGDDGDHYDQLTAAATAAIAALPVPVVALIHGFCIGGGLALAAAADLRYAADDVVFGLPPARLGIGYSAAGVAALVDLIGPAATKELIFTAEWVGADTALRWGLVNDVIPAAKLDAVVNDRMATIVSRAPLSQQAAKRAVANHLSDPSGRDDDAVEALIRRCRTSDDYREGVAAFLDKRPPHFTGR